MTSSIHGITNAMAEWVNSENATVKKMERRYRNEEQSGTIMLSLRESQNKFLKYGY
jgi:hypothetical protein